jgi:hypothetical protein
MTENKRVQTLLKAHRGVSDDDTRVMLLQVVTAAHALIERLCTMTSDEFSKGEEKAERVALADLIIFEGETMPFESDDDDVRFLAEQIAKHGHGGI